MSGPIRFVFTIIWIAIGLSTIGTLKDCTSMMGKEAVKAHQQHGMSLTWWNNQLNGKPKKVIKK